MTVMAYVLIEVYPGKAGNVVKALRRQKGVKSARTVTGPYDVVAMVEVPDIIKLGVLVIDRIKKIYGIARTLTLCVIEEL